MNQDFYTFLNLPVSSSQNIDLIKTRIAKQLISAQVVYVFSTWKLVTDPEQITLGLIGCGQVGKLIVNSLVPYAIKSAGLKPENVRISTRRPEQLNYYIKKGYQVFFDNDKVMRTCNFVIVAIPPVADNWNLLELPFKGKDQYVLSLISTLQLKQLQQLTNLKGKVFHTQVDYALLEETLKSYMEILESMRPGVFQTQVQEDVVKLIVRDSCKQFFAGSRLRDFMDSFDMPQGETFYQRFFGRNKEEIEGQLEKSLVTAYSKPLLMLQNFLQS